MNTALVLLPPQDRADLVPPPIEFLPISYCPFRFTSLSYPRYPAANSWSFRAETSDVPVLAPGWAITRLPSRHPTPPSRP